MWVGTINFESTLLGLSLGMCDWVQSTWDFQQCTMCACNILWSKLSYNACNVRIIWAHSLSQVLPWTYSIYLSKLKWKEYWRVCHLNTRDRWLIANHDTMKQLKRHKLSWTKLHAKQGWPWRLVISFIACNQNYRGVGAARHWQHYIISVKETLHRVCIYLL